MIPVRTQEIRHKAQLLGLLTKIADNEFLARNLFFKGGTAASLLGYLDRFSVDLDFDLESNADVKKIDKELKGIFVDLGLKIDEQSQKVPEYFLKYTAPKNERNTLKLDAFGPVFKANVYKAQNLLEIDRIMKCQTIETMFANKLVAVIDRFERHKSIAGRDIYDIHYFFLNGYKYEPKIILERTGLAADKYMEKLEAFIEKEVTETQINEDLNTLLLPENFQKIRKVLKREVLGFISHSQ